MADRRLGGGDFEHCGSLTRFLANLIRNLRPNSEPANSSNASREHEMTDTATRDDERIVGVWKLKAQVYEDTVTGERIPIFGDHPKGRQIATRDGRWLALATAEGRSTPKTDAERAQALLTMIAYTGRYRLKNGVVTTKVEAAWNESWVG